MNSSMCLGEMTVRGEVPEHVVIYCPSCNSSMEPERHWKGKCDSCELEFELTYFASFEATPVHCPSCFLPFDYVPPPPEEEKPEATGGDLEKMRALWRLAKDQEGRPEGDAAQARCDAMMDKFGVAPERLF